MDVYLNAQLGLRFCNQYTTEPVFPVLAFLPLIDVVDGTFHDEHHRS
jgi:hypothetical protein